jgi:hypothetical protein
MAQFVAHFSIQDGGGEAFTSIAAMGKKKCPLFIVHSLLFTFYLFTFLPVPHC